MGILAHRSTQVIAVVAMSFGATVAANAESRWQRYSDPETALAVDIPVDIFSREAGTAPHARKIVTSDGRANMTVQTVPNDRGFSPAAFLASKGPPPGMVYRRVTPRFFVVSSFKNDMIFYNRCNFSVRNAYCVLINYPARDKSRWDGIVTRISRSLTF
jgi:hypothetical protein